VNYSFVVGFFAFFNALATAEEEEEEEEIPPLGSVIATAEEKVVTAQDSRSESSASKCFRMAFTSSATDESAN